MKTGTLIFFCLYICSQQKILAEEINSKDRYWPTILAKREVVEYPVVFIHGIGGGFKDFRETASIISNNECYEMRFIDKDSVFHNYYGKVPGKWVWNISYYTVDAAGEAIGGDLTTYAERLKEIFAKIAAITGKNKFVVIAHSMGGLIARKYMTLDKKCWNSIYKILTVATPHNGVDTSVGIVGQLRDLRPESDFLKDLNKDWQHYDATPFKKWGVIGAVKKADNDYTNIKPFTTDGAGIGYVTISSSIPYNEEFKGAVALGYGKVSYDTDKFGFRAIVQKNHMEVLTSRTTLDGICWAITKFKEKITLKNWRRYAYPEGNFEIQYPKGTDILKTGLKIFLPLARKGTLLGSKYLKIDIREGNSNIDSHFSDGEIEEKQSIIINEVQFKKINSTQSAGGSIYNSIRYSTIIKNNSVHFIFILRSAESKLFGASPPPEYNRKEEIEIFEKIMKTFVVQ
ncbi:MAG: alpha/beta hydrolase [bacterium]|nr:alpha/beta hydrolase [bacterium]